MNPKLRGGYYTPDALADFLARWASTAGPSTLEPSAGDGAILVHLARYSRPLAVELDSDEAGKAAERSGVGLAVGDFFTWYDEGLSGRFDAVAGNPPYISPTRWAQEHRETAFAFLRRVGLGTSRKINAWVPFVAASVDAVRMGGRIALALPAELLTVDYAAELRRYVEASCTDVTVVTFRSAVFPDIQQDIALLLAVRGAGPVRLRSRVVEHTGELADLDPLRGEAVIAPPGRWEELVLDTNLLTQFRRLRTHTSLSPLSEHANVVNSALTGSNDFFCMTSAQARERDMVAHTVGMLDSVKTIRGLRLTHADVLDADKRGRPTRMLLPDTDCDLDPALRRYLDLGVEEAVSDRFKCRTRSPWWRVPGVRFPDGFMSRLLDSHLKIAANQAQVTSMNTLQVFCPGGPEDVTRLAVACHNSVTAADVELRGRRYGGGALALMTTSVSQLGIPDPSLVTDDLIGEVDAMLREGRADEARFRVDNRLLLGAAGMTVDEVELARSVHSRLRSGRERG